MKELCCKCFKINEVVVHTTFCYIKQAQRKAISANISPKAQYIFLILVYSYAIIILQSACDL